MTEKFNKQEREIVAKVFDDLESRTQLAVDMATMAALEFVRNPSNKEVAEKAAKAVAVSDAIKKFAEKSRESFTAYRSQLFRLLQSQECQEDSITRILRAAKGDR